MASVICVRHYLVKTFQRARTSNVLKANKLIMLRERWSGALNAYRQVCACVSGWQTNCRLMPMRLSVAMFLLPARHRHDAFRCMMRTHSHWEFLTHIKYVCLVLGVPKCEIAAILQAHNTKRKLDGEKCEWMVLMVHGPIH